MLAIAVLIALVPFALQAKSKPSIQTIKHRPPSKYIIDVPAEKKRSGFKEHMKLGFYTSLYSQYFSKEQPFSKGPVWQPSVTFEAYGAGLNVWSNFVLNNEANQGQFNEVDFTTYYTAHFGNLTIHPYILFEVFPNGNPRSLDYTTTPVIEPDINIQYNIWKFNLFTQFRTRAYPEPLTMYGHFGLGFNQPFANIVTFSASTYLNFGNGNYLTSVYKPMDANIDAIVFTASLPINFIKGFTFTPGINIIVHVLPEIRRAIRQNPNLETTMIWGGLDLAYEF